MSQRRVDSSGAVTAGCLPAGNASTGTEDATNQPTLVQKNDTNIATSHSKFATSEKNESLLRGGSPIAVARSSSSGSSSHQSEQQEEQQRIAGSSTGYAPAPRRPIGSSPSVYHCLQEFFQEEALSGISCAACSSLATQRKVEHKYALTASAALRNSKDAEKTAALKSSSQYNNKDGQDEVTLRILTEFLNDLKNMRVVGAKDAYIGDFDSGFVAHPPISLKKQAITHKPKTTNIKGKSVVEVDPTVVQQRDREMLHLSLKQPTFSDATKRTGLSRLPPLLCLYLCRRTYDEVKGRMKKLVAHVSFPVLLNMDQFQSADGAHRPTYTPGPTGAVPTGLSVTTMLTSTMKGRSLQTSGSGGDYQLRAVVEHKGTADTGITLLPFPIDFFEAFLTRPFSIHYDAGHYVAYCLVQEQPRRQWRLFSDEQHIQVPETTVLAAQATMLFYERVKARR